MIPFIIGLILGGIVGVCVTAVCAVGKDIGEEEL